MTDKPPGWISIEEAKKRWPRENAMTDKPPSILDPNTTQILQGYEKVTLNIGAQQMTDNWYQEWKARPLVDRLEKLPRGLGVIETSELCREAASRLEALEAENKRMREELEPYRYMQEQFERASEVVGSSPSLEGLMRQMAEARAAISHKTGEGQ